MGQNLVDLMNEAKDTGLIRERGTRAPCVARGYAARPGTGPEGETCGSCKHCCCRESGSRKRFYKCAYRQPWTHGPGTDIRFRSPACVKWERRLIE